MGFLSLYGGTVRIDITEPADPDGHWWVDIKKTLSGAELDIAEGKKLQMTAMANDDASAVRAGRGADFRYPHPGAHGYRCIPAGASGACHRRLESDRRDGSEAAASATG